MDLPDNQPLIIEKLVYGGDGLARLEGQVVLTPFVLPGERVIVSTTPKSGVLRGKVERLEAPSDERTTPGCPYFGRCGGCHYQQAGYAYQLEQKQTILREVLERIGHLQAPEEIETIAGPLWNYRNRVQLHIEQGRVGYREAGSHRLCPIERCPISSPKINEAIGALARMTGDRRFPRFVRSLELFTNETEVQINVLESNRPVARRFFDWCSERMEGAVSGAIDYTAAGATFRVGYRSFFQVNRFLMDRLVEAALLDYKGRSAIDLYAGVGLFSLSLARRMESVTAVESNAAALRDLEYNAERNGVVVDARQAASETFLERLDQAPDWILADPPRAGLGKSVVTNLLRLRPPRLTVIACDPATLARDLAVLAGSAYRIERMFLIDLFPQTYHIETIAHLHLR